MHDAANPAVQSRLSRAWRWARIAFAAVLALYVGLVIYRIPFVAQKNKSDAAVAKIRAQRLVMSDVDGTHLPPPPDPALADATIEGVDANRNGIRDDVELAIFKKYPLDAKLRAAELQYAMGLQTMLTQVFDAETWKAAAFETSRGYGCIGETYSRTDLKKFLYVTDARSQEVENIIFDTQQRKQTREHVALYTTSYGLPDSNLCDLSL